MARRALYGLMTLVLVVSTVFLIIRVLPSDPARTLAGENAPPERVAQIREELRLDEPILTQYLDYLGGLLRGDIGRSALNGRPVAEVVGERIPDTLMLALLAVVIGAAAGGFLGVRAARLPGRWVDRALSVATGAGVAIPAFWLGLLLIKFLAVDHQVFPASGQQGPLAIVLPALTLAVYVFAVVGKIVRSAMIEVLHEDFVRTALAKGCSPSRAVWRHGARNCSLSVLTVIGLQLGALLGGSVIVEATFSWPGLGSLVTDAITNQDLAVVQGGVLCFAFLFVLVNLLVDVTYGLLDPRIEHS
ncbi:ABC transporter permease [Acrocarpospora pleiomorpha]|uniref:ABC transporter permease n=1 Tax=Acrocarpospora pleiomorpha TaxID=90975 RepID=UPI00147852B2|nr:ABC transporter permease [Acrocarpospora pleiomorpha]